MDTLTVSVWARSRGLWRIRLASAAMLIARRPLWRLATWAASGLRIQTRVTGQPWQDSSFRCTVNRDPDAPHAVDFRTGMSE